MRRSKMVLPGSDYGSSPRDIRSYFICIQVQARRGQKSTGKPRDLCDHLKHMMKPITSSERTDGKYIEASVKAKALAFAQAFHRTIPREVRDIVYEHACTCGPLVHIYAVGPPGNGYNYRIYPEGGGKRSILNEGNWSKLEYVGASVVKEAIKSFYKKNRFIMFDFLEWRRFLQHGQFQLGMMPLDFMRTLTIYYDDRLYEHLHRWIPILTDFDALISRDIETLLEIPN